ncbi:hypothetical protein C2845_PM18G00570 [Panicum miliaceum]|uniref:non-specific serine/threonine protein kinase n=1 Tax=Panicum miliaceum TaxID=4540 RepID=A0A3L6PN72_PANMI|nr:hypothetical protein C2845_PM18G00570 [Panicum miliaceum]
MPRVLMASVERLASSPAGGPPAPDAPPPQSSAPPPPEATSSSPPPPTPSPPQHPPPPPPEKRSPPPPAPSGSNSPKSPFEQSLIKTPSSPPEKSSSTASPPPPASPPPSPPPTSQSPPPPSPSSPPPSPPPRSPPPPPPESSTPPSSRQSPPESSTPPPPTSSGTAATPPSPQTATSGSGSKTPATPREAPSTPGTPPDTDAQPRPSQGTPSSATQILPPPMALTVIMPGSGTPAGVWTGPPGSAATPPPLGPPAGSSGSSLKTEELIGISVGGLILTLASLFIFLCFSNRRGRKRHNAVVPEHVVSTDANGPAAASSPASGASSYDLSGSKSWFTYDELTGITGGFAAANVIGEGGFGKVYMGALGDGRRVAVKQLKVGGGQGDKEFRAEVDIISRIHHRHLVTLAGCCVTENHRLLVYEFVPNKTLEHHLHGKGLPVMDWHKRMKIAIGAARGLTYLHEDCHPRIIHRDIKSANILLDDAFEAKVADFGLAKLTNDSLTHISTRVMGTFGYMAPEYASSGKLTDRSDVFSFGVVLLELITGRKPVDASQPLGEESLVEWARTLLVDALETGDFREIADPALEGRFPKAEMRRMVEAAAACVRHSAAKRPRMVQVWRSLDVDEGSSDLTNGVKLGQSTAYDSRQYSADIELFRRMAFAGDGDGDGDDDEDGLISTAEFEDGRRGAGSTARK